MQGGSITNKICLSTNKLRVACLHDCLRLEPCAQGLLEVLVMLGVPGDVEVATASVLPFHFQDSLLVLLEAKVAQSQGYRKVKPRSGENGSRWDPEIKKGGRGFLHVTENLKPRAGATQPPSGKQPYDSCCRLAAGRGSKLEAFLCLASGVNVRPTTWELFQFAAGVGRAAWFVCTCGSTSVLPLWSSTSRKPVSTGRDPSYSI